MAFKFAARALLELGRELISSDEVAINELVKNSIDAGSPSVRLVWQVLLTHRDYEDALHQLEKRSQPAAVHAWLERRLIGTLGEEPKDHFAELHSRFLGSLLRATESRDSYRQALQQAYRTFNWIEV